MGVGHPHSVQMWKLRTREVMRHIQGHTASQGIATQDPLSACKALAFSPHHTVPSANPPKVYIHPGPGSSSS